MTSPSQTSHAPLATGELLSLHVGRIRDMLHDAHADERPAPWRSAIFKAPVPGPVFITPEGLPGDEQADLDNHGGPDNVVLAYDADHYAVWRERLDRFDLAPGWFGENFSVAGYSDGTVCIGDIWHVGPDLVLQVTQARQPCFKLARRLGHLDIVRLVRETSWGGWYLRVLHGGTAQGGQTITLTQRPHPEWPVARAVQTMYGRRTDPTPAQALATLPELSARWKQELLEQDS